MARDPVYHFDDVDAGISKAVDLVARIPRTVDPGTEDYR
jgi:hypothetical protein